MPNCQFHNLWLKIWILLNSAFSLLLRNCCFIVSLSFAEMFLLPCILVTSHYKRLIWINVKSNNKPLYLISTLILVLYQFSSRTTCKRKRYRNSVLALKIIELLRKLNDRQPLQEDTISIVWLGLTEIR